MNSKVPLKDTSSYQLICEQEIKKNEPVKKVRLLHEKYPESTLTEDEEVC